MSVVVQYRITRKQALRTQTETKNNMFRGRKRSQRSQRTCLETWQRHKEHILKTMCRDKKATQTKTKTECLEARWGTQT